MQALPSWPRGLAAALAAGTLVTALAAWPVLRHPTSVVFGDEIVGRQHDAYTFIFQLATGASAGTYAQPLTDGTAWLLGRLVDPVAAYNLLVLATFPLTVLTTYALGRYLFGVHGGALAGALAFAFAPLHVAHAAYHPHIAQAQWLPLYVLALSAFVSQPTILRGGALVASAAVVTLANYYAGFIAAVLTPVMLVTFWWADLSGRRSARTLGVGAAVLGGLAITAWATVAALLPAIARAPARYAWPVVDLSYYSARWWAYFVPPVNHPQLGGLASGILGRAGVTDGLLENQVSVSYALLSLAAVALVAAAARRTDASRSRAAIAVAIVGLVAAVISIGPGSAGCESAPWAPACVLYGVAPMFRAYARFGFVTHLSVALLAGAGASILAGTSRAGRIAAVALVVMAAYEYTPLPWRSHDVLPTRAHRWVAEQAEPLRVLDCQPPSAANATVSWLMKRPLVFLDDVIDTCADRDLPVRLRAIGIDAVVVRHDGASTPLFSRTADGLMRLRTFPDADLYRVTAPLAPIVTISRRGYSRPERDGDRYWRWMGRSGSWHVRNTTNAPTRVSLVLRLHSEREPRLLTVQLDGQPPQDVQVGVAPATYEFGPWVLTTGDHRLEFRPGGKPVRPSENGLSTDDRLLTIAFLDERWMEHRGDDDR